MATLKAISSNDVDALASRIQAPGNHGHYHTLPPGWTLVRQHPQPTASPLSCTTLQALVHYLSANRDELATDKLVLHVEAPERVALHGPLLGDRVRESYMVAKAPVPEVTLDRFAPLDTLRLMLRYGFVDDPNRARVLAALSKVTSDSKVTDEDGGVTQKVTFERGDQIVDKADLPSPIILAPWRSFPEVDQVASEYVLRVQNDGAGLSAGLWSADGNAWYGRAIERVADYLVQELSASEIDVPVLS